MSEFVYALDLEKYLKDKLAEMKETINECNVEFKENEEEKCQLIVKGYLMAIREIEKLLEE